MDYGKGAGQSSELTVALTQGEKMDREVPSRAPTSQVATSFVTEADNSSDCISTVYRGLTRGFGGCYALACLPLSCFGCGPMKTIQQGYVGVVKSFGRYSKMVGPGTYAYNIACEEYIPVSMKIVTLDIPPQHVMTKDNLTVNINAVVYFRVFDAAKATFSVENYSYAATNLAQCTLRTIVGENTLQELFNNRKYLNERLTQMIDEATDEWGISVSSVEIKDVTIPQTMQRAMAAVAEASREAEAKVIQAQGQLAASTVLRQAADEMSANKMSLQLQWFTTLQQIAQEKNSTIIVPDNVTSMLSGLAK